MKNIPFALLALCFIACNKQKQQCTTSAVDQAKLTGKFIQAGSFESHGPKRTITNCEVHFYADSFTMKQHLVVLDELHPDSCLSQLHIEYTKGKWSLNDGTLALQGTYSRHNAQNSSACVDSGKYASNYGVSMCGDTIVILPPMHSATALGVGIKLYQTQ